MRRTGGLLLTEHVLWSEPELGVSHLPFLLILSSLTLGRVLPEFTHRTRMLLEMVSSPRSKPGGGGAGRHPGSLNPFHGGGPFDSWVLRSMSGACFKKRMSFPLFLLFPVFPSLLDSHTWSLTCLILCHPKKPCVPSRTGLPPGCCPFTCSFCSPPSTLLARAL